MGSVAATAGRFEATPLDPGLVSLFAARCAVPSALVPRLVWWSLTSPQWPRYHAAGVGLILDHGPDGTTVDVLYRRAVHTASGLFVEQVIAYDTREHSPFAIGGIITDATSRDAVAHLVELRRLLARDAFALPSPPRSGTGRFPDRASFMVQVVPIITQLRREQVYPSAEAVAAALDITKGYLLDLTKRYCDGKRWDDFVKTIPLPVAFPKRR